MNFCTRLLQRAWRDSPPVHAAVISPTRLLILGIAGAMAACSQDAGQPTEQDAVAPLDAVAPVNSAADARPNILFVVADDLGYTDIGAFGSEISTPNLDELAFAGVRLTNFRTHSACQQTRVMLMASANATDALEIRPTQPSRERANRLSLNWAIIPELLQDAGYETYLTGKWDLGLEEGYTPSTRGFDRSFVQLGASASHFPEILWDDYSLYRLDGETVEYEDLPPSFYTTDYYTDRMIEFIDSGEPPWFGFVPYTTPHWPLHAPEDWLDRYAGRYDEGYDVLRAARVARAMELGVIPEGAVLDDFEPVAPPWEELSAEDRRGYARAQEVYAAMVENLDFNFGRLVDYLEESGQLENTVIVFSSDNGASTAAYGIIPTAAGAHPAPPGFIDNSFENWGRPNSFIDHGRGFAEAATAPLQGYKGTFSEGGLRTTAFVHFPAAVQGDRVNGTLMSMLDILPTFLDIAGTAHPGPGSYRGREINGILGRSFWPHLTGETAEVHAPGDSVGWSRGGGGGALVRGDYKLINTPAAGGMGTPNTSWRLYNIAEDPGEHNDLADEMPDLTAELIQEWEQNWR